MVSHYHARWISKTRADAIRKQAIGKGGVLLAAYHGMIIIEPDGADWGDGAKLSPPEADYELQPVWCGEPKSKLAGARKLLGLERVLA